MQGHTFVFIGGAHRSGTSLMNDWIGMHPQVSVFTNTGVPEDEGQHLQTVIPPDTIIRPYRLQRLGKVARLATVIGGAGKMAFRRSGPLDESSRYATSENAAQIFSEWSAHWDVGKRYLVEKSPPNVIRSRLLQALFKDSRFVMLVRHPIPVSMSTLKFRRAPQTLGGVLRHWLKCHELLLRDLAHVDQIKIVAFERLVRHPTTVMDEVFEFLGLEQPALDLRSKPDPNARGFKWWVAMDDRRVARIYKGMLIQRYEDDVQRFGYSLLDLDRAEPEDAFSVRRPNRP